MKGGVVRKVVLLPLAPAEAFELFTRHAGAWWPPERRHTKDAESAIVLEPGGRFFERSRAGVEVELGRVRVWEEPARLELDFYVATGEEAPTDVTVTFSPEGDATRVVVEHRPTAASAGLWKDRAPRYADSWERVLACLRAAIADR